MPSIFGAVRYFLPTAFAVVRGFVDDDSGQDLIEYAYLAAFIGVAGYVVLNSIVPAVGGTYNAWMNPTTGVPSLWEPAQPWSSGS
jgi:Flp pilus assembly pilin Flp